MLQLKYFRKIEQFESEEDQREKRGGRVEPFDISVLGVDGIFATVIREYRRLAFIGLGWLSRTFWPVMRIGRLSIVSRHKDVVDVLRRPEDFNVPFGPEIIALTGGENFMLGLDGPTRERQRKLVVGIIDPKADLEFILKATRRYTEALLNGSAGRIDVMRDLLGRVFTEVSNDYFGLYLEEPDDFLDRSFAVSNLLFADLFGNPKSRSVALTASAHMQEVIRRAITLSEGKMKGGEPARTFIERLLDKKVPHDEIVSIVIGTLTGTIPTNTMGAGKMIEELLRHPAYFRQAIDAACGYKSATDDVAKARHRQRLYDLLLEAGRLNPALFPGQWRYAPRDTMIGAQRVKAGTVLMVASMAAMRDPTVFAKPNKFWPDRPMEPSGLWEPSRHPSWLMFGTGVHYCFGDFIAIEQFTEIFLLLLSRKNVRPSTDPAGRLTYLGPYPRRFDMEFDDAPGRQQQTLVTIQAPLRPDIDLDSVQKEIAKLGNPAGEEMTAALHTTGVVHFASLQAFDVRDPDDDSKPHDNRLVLELSVDGTPEQGMWAVASRAFEHLAPLFEYTLKKEGEKIADQAALYRLFVRNQIKLTFYPWETTGLAFNGTPDCSVHDIEVQDRIATAARRSLESYVQKKGSPGTRPMTALRHVRQAIRRDEALRDHLIRPSRRRLAIAEWQGVGATAGLASIFLSRPLLLIYGFLALFSLTSSTVIWQLTHAPSLAASCLTAALTLYLLGMVCWPLVDSRLHPVLSRVWLHARLWCVRGLVAILGLSITAVVVGSNLLFLYWLQTFLPWPGLLLPPVKLAIAVLLSWWLLKAEYRIVGFLIDNAKAVRRPIRILIVALCGFALSAAAVYSGWGVETLRTVSPYIDNVVRHVDSLLHIGDGLKYVGDQLHIGETLGKWLTRAREAFLEGAFATSVIGVTGFFGDMLKAADEILFALAGGVLTTLAGVIVLGGAFLALLRHNERLDLPDDRAAPLEKIKEIAEKENAPGYMQNHILSVTPMKDGWFRRLTLSLGLWGIDVTIRYWCRPGFVINMGTIHYARWLRLPHSDALVFFSNYDGSWENYLEDFVTKAHKGQTAAWTNGKGFPRTRYMIFDGVEDASRFKRWTRRQQRPSLFWYSRFPKLTTDNIRNNALIHHGLMRASTDPTAAAWMDCFGTLPRPDFKIESEKVQSLVFQGFPERPFMTCAMVRFPVGADAARANDWLNKLLYTVWFGDPGISRDKTPTFVAFSQRGLRKLLDAHATPETLDSFPPAFRIGMADRKKILRDAGNSAPHLWEWSDAEESGIDAMLFVYGRTQTESTRAIESHYQKLCEQDVFGTLPTYSREAPQGWSFDVFATGPTAKTLQAQEAGKKGHFYEHFGFRDGLSQPVIIGTQKSSRDVAESDLVEPGEMILGYRDSSGRIAPPLTMPAKADWQDDLPVEGAAVASRFPRFADVRSAGLRDFGRNGTFLTVRQFQQHVDVFETFTREKAEEIALSRVKEAGSLSTPEREQAKSRAKMATLAGCPIDHEWVASKLMGRSRDGKVMLGRSLEESDNDFDFGLDDPQGLSCPFGAHVRRANPRGALHPGDSFEPQLMKRHRLLRRGRAYQKDGEKGLMFMAICADIERQFEFLQQTWIGSPSFAGLQNEPDPIVGTGSSPDRPDDNVFTIPTTAGPLKLKGVPDFVTVKGGGYLFMPGLDALRFLASATKIRLPRK